MCRSLSLDLRERILAFIEEGHSCREAARRFWISAASAVRIRQRYRLFGTVAPARRARALRCAVGGRRALWPLAHADLHCRSARR